MKTFSTRRICSLFLALTLSACSTTSSGSYVADMTGFSVTEGRIQKITGLATDKVEPLSDGLAVTLSAQGCSVVIEFANDTTKVFDLGPGVILVHGYEKDYILQNVSHLQSGRDAHLPRSKD